MYGKFCILPPLCHLPENNIEVRILLVLNEEGVSKRKKEKKRNKKKLKTVNEIKRKKE